MKIKIPNYLKFSTFVWLTSVFLTATFLMMGGVSNAGLLGGKWNMFTLIISISFGCSIPNWILLSISTWKVNKLQMTERKKKIIINAIAVILTFLLFFILSLWSRLIGFSFGAPFAYSLTLTLGIWIFPLQNKTTDMIWRENILDDNIFKNI